MRHSSATSSQAITPDGVSAHVGEEVSLSNSAASCACYLRHHGTFAPVRPKSLTSPLYNERVETQRAFQSSVACLGRPINDVYPSQSSQESGRKLLRFKNPLQDWIGEPLTLRERAIIGIIENIIGKDSWKTKVFDKKICANWRLEARNEAFSEKMFDFCIAELRENARFSERRGFSPLLDATATAYAGDDYVSNDVRTDLQRDAKRLQHETDGEHDWHPGSHGKVLNLVHPSLYSLIYARSRAIISTPPGSCLRGHWKGEIIPVPAKEDCELVTFYNIGQGLHTPSYSQKFQWLPCDVQFEADEKVRITSYINNLHPQGNERLCEAIEHVIQKAVPMWSETLTMVERNHRDTRIKVTSIELYEAAKRPRPPAENESELDEDKKIGLDWMWAEDIYRIVPPEPSDYAICSQQRHSIPSWAHKADLRNDFAEQGLQIIVKLGNIHLSPDNPEYAGGSWHIEGQLNEHICASALYYYDSRNVSDSYLAFRELVDRSALEELPYEQGQYAWIEEFSGMQNECPFIQELGHVLTKQGRLLTFPNVFQHRVEPFRLEDPSKSGHRKVLALFLVDPHLRIPSTSIVPPQQKEWWQKAQDASSIDTITRLPPGTARSFFEDNSTALVDIEEAKTLRMELMTEKSAFVEDVETPHLRTSTNFREH